MEATGGSNDWAWAVRQSYCPGAWQPPPLYLAAIPVEMEQSAWHTHLQTKANARLGSTAVFCPGLASICTLDNGGVGRTKGVNKRCTYICIPYHFYRGIVAWSLSMHTDSRVSIPLYKFLLSFFVNKLVVEGMISLSTQNSSEKKNDKKSNTHNEQVLTISFK